MPQKHPNSKPSDHKSGSISVLNSHSSHQMSNTISSAQKPKKTTLLTEKQSYFNVQKTPQSEMKQRHNSEKRKTSSTYYEPRKSLDKKVKVQSGYIQLCNEGSYSQKKRHSQNQQIPKKFLQTSISSRNSIYPQNQDTDTKSGTRNSSSKKQNSQNSNSKKKTNTKRFENIKTLVKKQQQQKSLSRDFTTVNPQSNRLSLNTQQFQLFKSSNELAGQALQTQNTFNTVSTSQSPNKYTIFLTKKKLASKAKNVGNNKQVIQYKPPLKKNLIHLLNQQVLGKTSTQLQSQVGSKKNSVSYVSRKGSSCSAYSNDHKKKASKDNTQEKSRFSDHSIQSIKQEVEIQMNKGIPSPFINNFWVSQEQDKENQDQVMEVNELDNLEDFSQIDQNFNKLIDQLEYNSGEYQLNIDPFMKGGQAKFFKNQLERIRISYEKLIKNLQEKNQRCRFPHSERNVIQNQRVFSEKQIYNEEEVTTYATTSPHQDLFSSQSSFRHSQIPQPQYQKKIQDLEQENKKLREQLISKNEVISHQDKIIEILKQEPEKEDVGIQTNQAQLQMSESRADILVETEQFKRKIRKLEKKVEYHKNKENKFLFFLFTLQNKGIPVNDIYEEDGIRDIPTARFAEIMQQNEDGQQLNNMSSLMFSFYSDDSFEPIQINPVFAKKKGNQDKPRVIPKLDLLNLPQYESSSDEEDNDPPKTPPDAYAQSMKYIENFYNKCAMVEGKPTSPPKGEDDEYVLCQPNNDSSIGQMQGERNEKGEGQPGVGSMLDDEFCYSIDKSRCKSSFKDRDRKSV